MTTVLIVVVAWMALGLLLAFGLGAAIRLADDNTQHCPQEDDDTASERVEKYL